jgi:hypothetical protein
MNRYRSLLHRVDAWRAEQRRQAEMDDLERLAETSRARIMQYLQAHRDGSPLPVLERVADCGSCDAARGARERLRARLDETGQRLRRYIDLRETHGIE